MEAVTEPVEKLKQKLPTWIYHAGEALFIFATESHDEPSVRHQIKSIRDQFYEYMKPHEQPVEG